MIETRSGGSGFNQSNNMMNGIHDNMDNVNDNDIQSTTDYISEVASIDEHGDDALTLSSDDDESTTQDDKHRYNHNHSHRHGHETDVIQRRQIQILSKNI